MITPFERYVSNSIELALMREGFVVYSEPRTSDKSTSRLDLVATKTDNQNPIGIEIKAFNRKREHAPKAVKPRFAKFRDSKIPVYTVFVSSEPKRIYLDQALARIIHLKDSYVAVLRDAV